MSDFFLYLPLGVLAGLCAGLFGVGGGIVIVPFLLVAFEIFAMDPEVMMHLAVGTSLACVVPTAASSTWGHHRKGAVMWPWFRSLVPFLILGGLLGGWTADQLPGDVLAIMLGTFLIHVASVRGDARRAPPPSQEDLGEGVRAAGGERFVRV